MSIKVKMHGPAINPCPQGKSPGFSSCNLDKHKCDYNGDQLETLFHGSLISLAHEAEFLEAYSHGLDGDHVAPVKLFKRKLVSFTGKHHLRHQKLGGEGVGLADFLEDILGARVDLTTPDGIKPNRKEYVMEDLRYV